MSRKEFGEKIKRIVAQKPTEKEVMDGSNMTLFKRIIIKIPNSK